MGRRDFRDLDVDDILFEFLEGVQRIQAPGAGRLIDDQGLTFAKACECGSTERDFAAIKLEEAPDVEIERWVCSVCDALWVFNHGVIAVNEVKVPKSGGAFEHQLDELRLFQDALNQLTLWQSRLYLQLWLWEGNHDRREVAKLANRRWRTTQWSEWKVRRTISDAQKAVHYKLGLHARARRHQTMTLEDHLP